MANQRIDQLNAETTPAAADVLPVFSIAGSDTKKITVKNLVQVGATLIDDGSIPASKVNLAALNIVNANIDANAEISVSKLIDGSARQLLQTDAAGTGVEWASNIDIPGTLDVTNAATFDSTVAVTGALTKSGSNVVTVGDTGTVTSTMLMDGTIVDADINANAEISVSKLVDGLSRQLLQTDAAGTGVEWASDIDIPGTLDVTSAATFDSTVAVTGALTKSGSNVVTVGDTGTVTSAMLLDGTIVNADINASAAIVDTKLATIATAGKINNSATTATDANTASAIVARDASGNFTAGTITAALAGNASTVTTNANLTGHVTSVGNAAVLGSFTSAQLAAALTDETGTGATVFATSPVLVTPALGTPSSGTLTNCTFPTLNQNTTGNAATVTTNANLTGDITSTGNATSIAAGVIVNADINASAAIDDTKLATIATALKVSNSATTAASANTASAIVARDASGNFTAGTITAALTGIASGNLVSGGALGTPSSGTLTSCTGLPISTGVSGLGTGAATFLATPSSANLAALLTDETGSGANVFATSPTLINPALGTPSSGSLTNCTNLPVATSSVVGAVSIPAAGGLALTGGGALSHSNAVAGGASTRSGITYDLQGHIVSTAALVASDMPIATGAALGAVIAGTGLAVDGNGILSTGVATTSNLGGIKIGSEFGLNGSNQLLLAVQANVAGGTAYQKVTVNSKGVVTAGAALDATDIPNLDASKITTGSVDIARIAANTITGAKVANYAVTKIGDTQPTADHIGQFFFNPLSRDLFLWDGNVFQPIGISVGEIVFGGTFDASAGGGTGHVASVTSEGTAIGLVQGSPLPAAATANNRYYLVVSEAGTITSGNAPNVALSPPDIVLSTGLIWTEVDVSQTFTSVSASQVAFTPEGTITAANVQSAIEEVNNEKLSLTGGTISGTLEIGTTGSLSFEGSTANSFETTVTAVDPTADRTITFPNISGTIVTTGDTGSVTSVMLLDGTIVDADISATAEIAVSKLVDGAARQLLQTDAAGTGVEWASNIDIPGTLDVTSAATFDSTVAVTGALTKSGSNVVTVGDTGTVTSTMLLDGTIVDADINASAAIAYSKLAALTSANIVLGSSANVATSTAVTGDVTISNTGVTAIATGVIVNADINASAAIVDTKLATISTAGKVSNSATTAASANTASAIVARDASGNFTAGTINATELVLSGDLTVDGTTTTINSTTLTVDDKNIELGSVVSPTNTTADGGGITLKGATDKTINWINATGAWTLSEHVNIASAKEYRIAGTKVLDATSLGSAVVSSSLTSVGTIGTGTWQGTAIVDTYLGTISTALKVSNSATTATSANTALAIVARDASGNFTAGTITAALTGTASGNLVSGGALGTPSSGTLTNCTFPTLNQNTTGNAATVTTNANLTGDVTSVGNVTSIAAGVILDADINASAAIVDTKLATIATAGKVSNSATTAASANTASTIVARDASGNFTAGTITAGLTGNASTATTLATARNIQGVSFDGSAAITVVTAGSGISVTGTAVANTGVLSVNSNTGAITNVAVTNAAQSYSAAQRGTVSALGTVSAGTTTLDLATANNFSLTLPAGGSVTLGNPSNQTAGQSGVITITQNGTTAATVPYGGNWKFQGGAPTVSTTLSSVNVIAYYVESASRITAQLLTNTVS